MSAKTKISDSRWYLVTIKKRQLGYTNQSELDEVLRGIRKRMRGSEWISKIAYELDAHDILHMHTMVRRTKSILWSAYQRPGWNIHFAEITPGTFSTVYKYINKEASNVYEQEQVLARNYYRNNYAFDNSGSGPFLEI